MAAQRVPPVAIRSSTTKARSADSTAPTCISRQSLPYSKMYSSEITLPEQSSTIILGTMRKRIEEVYVTNTLIMKAQVTCCQKEDNEKIFQY